jgi:flagella basal body P-ring formation protein FlgA
MKVARLDSWMVRGVAAIAVVWSTAWGQDCRADKGRLRVYLPREVVIKSDSIKLGSVGIMQGDEVLSATAKEIGLGKFALTGQQIVIDRQTILSRLASNGIRADEVAISGAGQVTVKRDENIIGGARFEEVAKSYLKVRPGYETVGEIKLVRKPKDWVLADDSGEIQLAARMSRHSRKDKAKVWVGVVKDGAEVGGCEVAFDLKYKRRRAVATVDIAEGVVISPENVRVEKMSANSPADVGWSAPYGLVAKRRIKKGSVLNGSTVGPVEPPVVIKRRQTVVMKIETDGLSISALGQALSDGKVGEFIRVKGLNRNSRIIVGKVKQDGTVEPVL